jgi:DNA-binding MarR family transcriptional regulator
MATVAEHPDVQVFDEINQIEHLLRTTVSRCLAPGLTYPQFEVLNHLSRRGDAATPADLADSLQASRSGFTHTLQSMEVAGLISVAGDSADRRRKRVSLTPKGRKAYGATMNALRPRIEHLRGGITLEEFRGALPFLQALRTWMFENR